MPKLGDRPIEKQFYADMNLLADMLHTMLNGEGCPIIESKVGFILMVFNFGEEKDRRANYISNCERNDVVQMLKEQVKHFEKQFNQKGKS